MDKQKDAEPPEDVADDFEYDDGPEDDCLCDDADYDILTGRAHCWVCGRFWYLTPQEPKP